jgi:hypothetical protein
MDVQVGAYSGRSEYLTAFHAPSNWRGSPQIAFVLLLLTGMLPSTRRAQTPGGVGGRCLLHRIASTAGETTSDPSAGNGEPATMSLSFTTTKEI